MGRTKSPCRIKELLFLISYLGWSTLFLFVFIFIFVRCLVSQSCLSMTCCPWPHAPFQNILTFYVSHFSTLITFFVFLLAYDFLPCLIFTHARDNLSHVLSVKSSYSSYIYQCCCFCPLLLAST